MEKGQQSHPCLEGSLFAAFLTLRPGLQIQRGLGLWLPGVTSFNLSLMVLKEYVWLLLQEKTLAFFLLPEIQTFV